MRTTKRPEHEVFCEGGVNFSVMLIEVIDTGWDRIQTISCPVSMKSSLIKVNDTAVDRIRTSSCSVSMKSSLIKFNDTGVDRSSYPVPMKSILFH